MSDEIVSEQSSEVIEDSGEELQEEGLQTAEDIQEEIKEQKKMLRKLKLKFNGREVEEELPFEIPEEYADYMTKQLQMAKLSQHKSQELSQFEKEVTAFLQDLKTNPKKALSNPAIGIDVKQLAAEILEEEIAQAQKTPEQIERERLEAELHALREEREREKTELEQRELERLTDLEYERYDNLMSNAIENSDLPKTPYVVKKMTEYMIQAVDNNIDVEPADLVPIIREEIQADVRVMLQSMPPEMVEQFLGQEVINTLRKSRVASVKKAPVPVKSAVKDIGKAPAKKAEAPRKPVTIKDFFGV
jgi:hypothetical protein